jgi:hypothetical protein
MEKMEETMTKEKLVLNKETERLLEEKDCKHE